MKVRNANFNGPPLSAKVSVCICYFCGAVSLLGNNPSKPRLTFTQPNLT